MKNNVTVHPVRQLLEFNAIVVENAEAPLLRPSCPDTAIRSASVCWRIWQRRASRAHRASMNGPERETPTSLWIQPSN